MYMKVIVILLGCFLFVSCSSHKDYYEMRDADGFSVSITDIKSRYANVVKLVKLKQDKDRVFTPMEWSKLTSFNTYVSILIMKYEAMTSMSSDIDVTDVEFIVKLTKMAYDECHSVVSSKWSSFDEQERSFIIQLESEIKVANARFDYLLEQEEINEVSIKEILFLVLGVLNSITQMAGQTAL